jgi:hypothetical protein
MAGGPIYPSSVVPITSGKVWIGPYTAADASIQDLAIQVMASLNADAIVRLVFPMPVSALPSGTCKLRLLGIANATANDAKINPKWGSVAAAESAQAVTRTAEGVSTLTWAAGDADKYKELKITLDADTPTAGEFICMDLTFTTANWTLAAISTWIPSIIWE